MQLPPPLADHLSGARPTHCSTANLSKHVSFLGPQEIIEELQKGGFVQEGKPTKKALVAELLDRCEGKVIWNIKEVKKELLARTKKESQPRGPARPIVPTARIAQTGPVWTDLENIGTYFGVGKNKVGQWLDQLGLRGHKPVQINESGDIDMLDIANQSKEKFQIKIPTEKALASGIAQVEVVEYRGKGGSEKAFEKYTWDRDRVKDILVKAGHPLDTERKLLHRGKGKNGNIQVSGLDQRAQELHKQWEKLHMNPATRAKSWDVFKKQPSPILIRVEQILGRPRYLRDKLYLKEK